ESLPGFRIKSVHRFGVEDEELSLAGGLDHRRCTVSGLRGVETLPQFLPVGLVKGYDARPFTARDADELVTVEIRVAGEAPEGSLRRVVFLKVLFPDQLARVGIEARQPAFGAKKVDAAVAHGRRHPRTVREGNGVASRVLVGPERLAGRFLETENALGAVDLAAFV